jgi:hypothetical protein
MAALPADQIIDIVAFPLGLVFAWLAGPAAVGPCGFSRLALMARWPLRLDPRPGGGCSGQPWVSSIAWTRWWTFGLIWCSLLRIVYRMPNPFLLAE